MLACNIRVFIARLLFIRYNRVHPETFRTERAISNAPIEALEAVLECCRKDTKEAMICIDNNYALIKFTNIYQIKHIFLYFYT